MNGTKVFRWADVVFLVRTGSLTSTMNRICTLPCLSSLYLCFTNNVLLIWLVCSFSTEVGRCFWAIPFFLVCPFCYRCSFIFSTIRFVYSYHVLHIIFFISILLYYYYKIHLRNIQSLYSMRYVVMTTVNQAGVYPFLLATFPSS